MPTIDLLIALVLCLVFYQDVKYRAVGWYFFALLAVLFIWKFANGPGAWWHIAVNSGFVLVQLAVVSLYVYRRYGSWDVFDSYLGLGDVLIWGVFVWGFSPLNFVVFFIGGLIFSLIAYGFFWMRRGATIPLAGLQGLFYVMLLSLGLVGVHMDWYNDYKLIELIGFDWL